MAERRIPFALETYAPVGNQAIGFTGTRVVQADEETPAAPWFIRAMVARLI
jgi:hypothetical protein